jgi:hypothetical protein
MIRIILQKTVLCREAGRCSPNTLDKAFFLISFMLKESEKHQKEILMILG